ncbi:Uma2 family endonuclease [Gloeobacter kilaueensis]|uniref:Type I restriction enzyme EcoKI subunit R n=1 Tax=Gloeobacter kilaueensis (strain ATCC BAA-2537 / CCAP 1431/1 / ULC 316 / JS1) TaxID=1183438 RepID=U5QBY4_GLOK1|nr:Uma2 family endonuclease [Gloeobacter kilaueensis]AGY56412.1 type I restriction enzyme EcoKI subunit R [Gloeobacter kilaueensis JS1]
MTTLVATTPVTYPSGDGRPLAETFLHVYAILTTLEVLRQYLEGSQATVLANQFLYYAPGVRTSRVAPDVMVIFGVAPGPRDSYKTWEEGQVPAIIFEITSESTRSKDQDDKLRLYEFLGVQEYWLFDPKGEWIQDKLRGYRLQVIEQGDGPVNHYQLIEENISERLQLRLQVEGELIGFYRLDNSQKLLIPSELAAELRATAAQLEQSEQRAQAAEQRAQAAEAVVQQEQQARQQAEQRAAELAERLRELGIDPDTP